MLVPNKGIFCGNSSIVTLADGDFEKRLLKPDVTQFVRITNRAGGHPNSIMGTIALIRQTLFDTQWYRDAHTVYQRNPAQSAPETNVSLESLLSVFDTGKPVLFDASNDHRMWQARKLAGGIWFEDLDAG
jgi:hypothetical protein